MNLKFLITQAPWRSARINNPTSLIEPDHLKSDDLLPYSNNPEIENEQPSKQEWIEIPLDPGEYELLFGEKPSKITAEFGKKLYEIKSEFRLPSLEVGFADDQRIAFRCDNTHTDHYQNAHDNFIRALNITLKEMVNDVLTPTKIEKPMLFASAPWKK